MKKIFIVVLLLILGLNFGACVSSTTPGIGGGSFITVTTQHVYGLSQGNQITSARVEKSGESCSLSSSFILSWFYYGNGGSIEEASKKGGITKIAVVDRSSVNFLGRIFYLDCVIVWGE
ncbi:TRL domain-containing protein [Leptospira sp. GIMC2001]|uniref:TRL domain-containing protein n=1 Tax=Leptospira sp. GIMC2001 TaxID=1513297 RepID=UPI00234B621A|nr:TRL domain-containing protein [Leptospira sp. GIMC2001]WCL51110.1 hypothetical protein O4O04_09935 [Leptospira sp. GIMC2001]